MSHYAVHVPFDRDMRYYQSYIDKGMPAHEAAYASLVEGMDKSLGDIMDWLEANNQADNTIIIFMSDNGGYATSNAWRDGDLYVQNYPLNSGKGSLYEGGIREPMIVSWHGVTAPGSRCNDIVAIEDFYPSILEMAQITNYTTTQTLDGRSFVPELRGEHRNDERTLYWNFPNNWGNDGPGINFNCAIRQGDWKLVYYYETGKKELFNIADDIGEKTNLAAKQPKITKKLAKALGEYLRSCGAQRPTFTATSQPCAWPDE
jgi:arylsulfatase A-like enzyme